MKKLLRIVVLSLLFSFNANAFSLTLPVLECEWGNEEQIVDLKQINKKKDGSVKKTSTHYNFEFIGKKDNGNDTFNEKKISGSINRSTGDLTIKFSKVWDYFFDSGNVSKEERFSENEFILNGKCEKSKSKNL
tara:strand:+ start:48 stop:446 length:399 start_codon:yes stop_codon:yes gene_type:complete